MHQRDSKANFITTQDVIKVLEAYRDSRGFFRKHIPGRDAESKEIKELMELTSTFRAPANKKNTEKFEDLKDLSNQEAKPLTPSQLYKLTEILVKNELNEKRNQASETSKALKKLEQDFNKKGIPLSFFLICKKNDVYSEQIVNAMYKSGDAKRAGMVMECYLQAKKMGVEISSDSFVKELFKDPNVIVEVKYLLDNKKFTEENFAHLCKQKELAAEKIAWLVKLGDVKFNYLPKQEAEKFILTYPKYIDRFFALMSELSKDESDGLELVFEAAFSVNEASLIKVLDSLEQWRLQDHQQLDLHMVLAAFDNFDCLKELMNIYQQYKPIRDDKVDMQKNKVFLKMLLTYPEQYDPSILNDLVLLIDLLNRISLMQNAPPFLAPTTRNVGEILIEVMKQKAQCSNIIGILTLLINSSIESSPKNSPPIFRLIDLKLDHILRNPQLVLQNLKNYNAVLEKVSPFVFTYAETFGLPICLSIINRLNKAGALADFILTALMKYPLKRVSFVALSKELEKVEPLIRIQLREKYPFLFPQSGYYKTPQEWAKDREFFERLVALSLQDFYIRTVRDFGYGKERVSWQEQEFKEMEEAQLKDAPQITLEIEAAFKSSDYFDSEVNDLISGYLYQVEAKKSSPVSAPLDKKSDSAEQDAPMVKLASSKNHTLFGTPQVNEAMGKHKGDTTIVTPNKPK